jgi:hypothetical protein
MVCKSLDMAAYVVTIDGSAQPASDRGASSRRLLIIGDDGNQRSVSVTLHEGPQVPNQADVSPDELWRAALFYAVEQLEIAFKGEGWGLQLEGGPTFDVEVSDDQLRRFVGAPSSGISLEDGATVGEFAI